jgi:N-acetyl-gamma-glutamyl-phosphate reductase
MRHPGARIEACFATDASFRLQDYLPEAAAASIPVLPMAQFEQTAARVKTVFLATPAEVSAELAPRALEQGADVIDLSGAFRLGAAEAASWYGLESSKFPGFGQALLSQASYGLVPWAGPVAGASGPRLVSNPGCYATAVLMALLPLLKAGLIDPATLVIDAKSGTSGAGRKAAENLLFGEVSGDCLPYKVGKHQHLPEIQKYATELAGVAIDPMFTTHLLPVHRGIIAGLYARVRAGVGLAQVETAFEQAYAGYGLARFGRIQGEARQLLSLKRVVGSARTEIRFELQGDKLYVFSLIDNLLKGAAGQAVENFNRLEDLPLTTALNELEGVL